MHKSAESVSREGGRDKRGCWSCGRVGTQVRIGLGLAVLGFRDNRM